MIIPGSKQYWELNDKMLKDKKDKYKYAYKLNNDNGRLYRSGKDIGVLYKGGHQAFEDSYIEVDVDYVYRAVSPEELENINKTGYIKSNQSMNMGYELEQGLTCFSDNFPGFYLPKSGGYILKVKVLPENEFFYDKNDEYIKTAKPIPKSQIVEIIGQDDITLEEATILVLTGRHVY